jgi:succinate-semialdehyde dehydrogenase/glutarate-semialdehyde dehydrogenase
VLANEPIGALLGVEPWNYQLYQVVRLADPNLLLGNTILLKHARSRRWRSRSSSRRRCARGRVHQPVHRDRRHPARHPAPDGAADVATGKRQRGCRRRPRRGAHVKKSVLELGGRDPFIVLDGERMARTIEASGQGSSEQYRAELRGVQALHRARRGLRRVVVRLHDRFAELRPGDPADLATMFVSLSRRVRRTP